MPPDTTVVVSIAIGFGKLQVDKKLDQVHSWPVGSARITFVQGLDGRQIQLERHADADLDRDADLAAVRLDRQSAEGEAKAGAVLVPLAPLTDPNVFLEDALEILCRDARPGVRYLDDDPPSLVVVCHSFGGGRCHRCALARLLASRIGAEDDIGAGRGMFVRKIQL